jgi:FKBP-type peptidyl-prolyl cis-trans isomerase FklB
LIDVTCKPALTLVESAGFYFEMNQDTMKIYLIKSAAAVALAMTGLMTCQAAFAQAAATPEADAAPAFSNRKDALSYAIGVSTVRNLMKDGVEINPDVMLKGIQDAAGNKRPLMSEKEIRSVMSGLVGEMRQKMATNRAEAETANKKHGDEYRASFSKSPDAKTLANGVIYKVIKAGTGPKPTEDDLVTVNYRGTLTNGTEFDASPQGKPATMKVSQLITGWKEALKAMPVGSHWTLVIPPQLAYGVRGVGTDIGPSETLVFDVELVSIKK